MKKKNPLFKMGVVDETSKKTQLIVSIGGLIFMIFIWWLITLPVEKVNEYGETITTGLVIKPTALPNPIAIFKAIGELYRDNELVGNTLYSVLLNLLGYVEAIFICIPLGFIMGLFPFFRHLFSREVTALRFVPLVAAIGVFIAWFGMSFYMKGHFLAFGIMVYLLPIVVQRVDETEKVNVDTLWTIGASSWQTFRHVYFPSVISKLWDDIRVITAISWTYIVFAEMVNNEGGLGSLTYFARKETRIDKVFAILLIIVVIGIIQDIIFKWADYKMFRFKYEDSKQNSKNDSYGKLLRNTE